MKKRLFALALTLALSLGLLTPAYAAGVADRFPAINTYSGYSDVKEGEWYAPYAMLCYEVGLMEGSNGAFRCSNPVTVAQAAAIAARIDHILNGGDGVIKNPADAEQWYTGVIAYMQALAEHSEDAELKLLFSSPEVNITRSGFFALMNLVVPEELLSPINAISSLPDTNEAQVLKFYNAGILTGVNSYGTFLPDKPLNRGEMAAMAARIVRPELRQRFTPRSADDPYAQDFDRCLYLMGIPGSSVYFTVSGLTVTADAFLDHAFETADKLYQACQEQGLPFDWGNTLEGKTFLAITYGNANYGALQDVWSQLEDPISFAGEAGIMRAGHILVSDKAQADALCAQLQADPSRFDALQAEFSEDGRDESGALYHTNFLFGPGEMVSEFEEGVKALQPGQIGAPVESQYGWHIIQRIPLTEEEAWSAFADRARMTFGPDFTTTLDLESVYYNWRVLIYGEF